jgi:hypothetical protein
MAKAALSQRGPGSIEEPMPFNIGDARSGTGTWFSPNSKFVPVIILTSMFLIHFRLSLALCIRGCRTLGAA